MPAVGQCREERDELAQDALGDLGPQALERAQQQHDDQQRQRRSRSSLRTSVSVMRRFPW